MIQRGNQIAFDGYDWSVDAVENGQVILRQIGSDSLKRLALADLEWMLQNKRATLLSIKGFESMRRTRDILTEVTGGKDFIAQLKSSNPKLYKHLHAASVTAYENTGDPAGEYGTLHDVARQPPSKRAALIDKKLVYDTVTGAGPDMSWERMGPLMMRVRKALGAKSVVDAWMDGTLAGVLDKTDAYGPASDRYRHSGDRYYPEAIHVPRDWEPKPRMSRVARVGDRVKAPWAKRATVIRDPAMPRGINVFNANKIIRGIEQFLGDVEGDDVAENCWTLAIDKAHEIGLEGQEAIDTAKYACRELGYPRK